MKEKFTLIVSITKQVLILHSLKTIQTSAPKQNRRGKNSELYQICNRKPLLSTYTILNILKTFERAAKLYYQVLPPTPNKMAKVKKHEICSNETNKNTSKDLSTLSHVL